MDDLVVGDGIKGHGLLCEAIEKLHAKPAGHRSRARYARHASSVPNLASSSVRFLEYSSTMPAYHILGLPESSGYPS